MQEALLGANSPQLALNNASGVIFSPLLKKQFAMVKQQLLERVTSKQEVSDMHTVQGVLVRLHAMMTVLRGSELLKLMGKRLWMRITASRIFFALMLLVRTIIYLILAPGLMMRLLRTTLTRDAIPCHITHTAR